MLADELVPQGIVDSISADTVGRTKNELKRWQLAEYGRTGIERHDASVFQRTSPQLGGSRYSYRRVADRSKRTSNRAGILLFCADCHRSRHGRFGTGQ